MNRWQSNLRLALTILGETTHKSTQTQGTSKFFRITRFRASRLVNYHTVKEETRLRLRS